MTSTSDPDDLEAIGREAAAFVAERHGRHIAKRLQAELDVSAATVDRLQRGRITWPLFGRMVRAYGRGFADQVLAPLLGTGTSSSSFVERVCRHADDSHVAALGAARRLACPGAGPAAGGAGAALHGGRPEPIANGHGAGTDRLGRFTGRLLECVAVPLHQAAAQHQRLAAVYASTSGEFTVAASAEMETLGLAATAWLYRSQPELPVLYIGDAIPIVAGADRERVLSRPVAEQPLPPEFLRPVLDHLGALLAPGAPPTVHRIRAVIGDREHVYDRLAANWRASGIVLSSCLLGAA